MVINILGGGHEIFGIAGVFFGFPGKVEIGIPFAVPGAPDGDHRQGARFAPNFGFAGGQGKGAGVRMVGHGLIVILLQLHGKAGVFQGSAGSVRLLLDVMAQNVQRGGKVKLIGRPGKRQGLGRFRGGAHADDQRQRKESRQNTQTFFHISFSRCFIHFHPWLRRRPPIGRRVRRFPPERQPFPPEFRSALHNRWRRPPSARRRRQAPALFWRFPAPGR